MAGWAWSYVSVIRAALLLLLASLLFMCLTVIGEKTMVDETITLSSGGQKTYNLPPGMVNVEIIETESPIHMTQSSMFGSCQAYALTGGNSRIGSPLFTRFTIGNPGMKAANVSLRISTGALNPFAYLGIPGSP